MNEKLQARYDLFTKNYYTFKNGFVWESNLLHPLCANIFTEKNLIADIEQLKAVKKLLNNEVGLFLEFPRSV